MFDLDIFLTGLVVALLATTLTVGARIGHHALLRASRTLVMRRALLHAAVDLSLAFRIHLFGIKAARGEDHGRAQYQGDEMSHALDYASNRQPRLAARK